MTTTASRANSATKTRTAAEPEPPAAPIQIEEIGTETLLVPIVGTSPLIVSRFSEKAKRQMLAAQTGKNVPKQKRDPQAEYEAALYLLDDDGYGLPVVAFKEATVGAARFYRGVTMKDLRQMLFVKGERSSRDNQQMVRLVGEPTMREDVVRLAGPGRSADLRYRPEFWPWSTTLHVVYVTGSLSQGSVLSLIRAGGFGVGVGEWRPERRGEFGTYEIDDERGVEVIRG